jgi:flagellar basal-body rod protein FlgB
MFLASQINQQIDHQGALLKLRAERQQLLASNIANADTPGYKARDFDFAAAVGAAASRRLALAATQAGHIGAAGAAGRVDVQYRIPSQDAIDGNTVEVDREISRFTENALSYQARAQFLNDSIRELRLAINGQG